MPPPKPKASKAEEALIAEYTTDWRRLQRQKSRQYGGVEARVLTGLAMYYGEHWVNHQASQLMGRVATDEDKNKLFLVFNMIRRATKRKIGRLWSIDHKFRATPNTLNPAAFDNADVVSKLLLALNRKVREGQQHWSRLFWMLIGGVVIEHTPWTEDVAGEALPEYGADGQSLIWLDQWNGNVEVEEAMVDAEVAKGTPPERFTPKETVQLVGDVGSELFNPLNFFIDDSVKSVRDLAGDQACYLAQIKTEGWIADNFGADAAAQISTSNSLDIVRTPIKEGGQVSSGMNLKDMIPAIQGTWAQGDPKMAIVLTRYQPKSKKNPEGRWCIFVPNGPLLHESTLKEYEGIPCVDLHWEPNATSFWSGDFLTDLIPGQKFLNKRMSQLGEAANAQIYELLLLGGELTATSIPTDYHGVVEGGLDENGNPLVSVMQRGQLPGFFNDSIRLAVEFIEQLGSGDLTTQRKFPGQLRGPLAIPMLQEILDSEDGPVYTHLGEGLAEIHQMRVNRVKQFYEPIRTLHYTGTNNRDEVLIFHAEKVLRSGWDYNINIDRASLLPELSSLREARVRERLESPLAALYMNRRTGKIDISKIADDLKYNDTNREDRESQYRKLAREFIMELNQGKKLDPNLPMPFYDCDVMMDEFEAAMATTEWLRSTTEFKQGFVDFYNKCQAILQKLHDAQQNVLEGKMMQNAVAMATQQAAAKAAAVAADAALDQVSAQQGVIASGQSDPKETMQQLMQKRGPVQ